MIAKHSDGSTVPQLVELVVKRDASKGSSGELHSLLPTNTCDEHATSARARETKVPLFSCCCVQQVLCRLLIFSEKKHRSKAWAKSGGGWCGGDGAGSWRVH